jgi:hypothetical protein
MSEPIPKVFRRDARPRISTRVDVDVVVTHVVRVAMEDDSLVENVI